MISVLGHNTDLEPEKMDGDKTMTCRHCAGRLLRKLFPDRMEIHDKRRDNNDKLERTRPNVHLTREQWIEKIEEQYRDKTGNALDLDNPQRYTAKIQWRKLYDKNPMYSVLADKYAVRQWVKDKIGEEYLIPLLGVWERAEDIDFRLLPESFVLKTNSASAANIIVRDKKDINRKLIIEQLNYWLEFPFWAKYGEFHYKEIPPKIIAERYMQCEGTDDLTDYKFLCFNGKPCYCTVEVDRFHGHKQLVYDSDWILQDWRINQFESYSGSIEKPAQFETMLGLAETLSKGFSHVRVDLYLSRQKIYFGEMTFTPGSGYVSIVPDEYDYILGEQWTLDSDKTYYRSQH